MTAKKSAAAPAGGLQVFVATPSAEVASRIADALLDLRLCACAQILGPVQSRYTWKGERESAAEFLLVLKTQRALFDPLAREVCRLHPYELPEIVGVPMQPVFAPYLAWITSSTARTTPRASKPRNAARRR